jgi:hypothetical protein
MTDTNESRRLRAEGTQGEVDWEARAVVAENALSDLLCEAHEESFLALGFSNMVEAYIEDSKLEITRLRAELAIAIAAMGPSGVPEEEGIDQ